MVIKKYSREEIDKMQDKTDYERLKQMPEDEIINNAESDPDVPPQTEDSLKKFKRIERPRGKNENH